MKDSNIQVEIKLCNIHKDFYEHQVKSTPSNKVTLFNLGNFIVLLERCGECKVEIKSV